MATVSIKKDGEGRIVTVVLGGGEFTQAVVGHKSVKEVVKVDVAKVIPAVTDENGVEVEPAKSVNVKEDREVERKVPIYEDSADLLLAAAQTAIGKQRVSEKLHAKKAEADTVIAANAPLVIG